MPVIENLGVNANRLAQFAQRLPGRGRPIFLTCVFGLAAGLAAVAFQLAMNALEDTINKGRFTMTALQEFLADSGL